MDPVIIDLYVGGPPDDGACPGGISACLRDLRSSDKAVLNKHRNFLRSDNSPSQKAFCEGIAQKVDQLIPHVKLGLQLPIFQTSHGGNTTRGVVHIDKSHLDIAASNPAYEKWVVNMLYHEALHVMGNPDHPDPGAAGYTTYPWNQLNFAPANVCFDLSGYGGF